MNGVLLDQGEGKNSPLHQNLQKYIVLMMIPRGRRKFPLQ